MLLSEKKLVLTNYIVVRVLALYADLHAIYKSTKIPNWVHFSFATELSKKSNPTNLLSIHLDVRQAKPPHGYTIKVTTKGVKLGDCRKHIILTEAEFTRLSPDLKTLLEKHKL